jgi:hypothetical protein
MATGTQGSTARVYHQQMVHYLRKGVSYLDKGATLDVGTIPAGALISFASSGVFVTQIFNGTANALNIGASTDPGQDNFGSALALTALGGVPLDEGANISPMVTADTKVQVNLAGVTGAPTAGQAEIVIAYVPDNDL